MLKKKLLIILLKMLTRNFFMKYHVFLTEPPLEFREIKRRPWLNMPIAAKLVLFFEKFYRVLDIGKNIKKETFCPICFCYKYKDL